MVAPTIGFTPGAGWKLTYACAMPAIAAAALLKMRSETRLIPEISTTEYIIVTSTEPTYGLVSPEARVETISFGTPIGRARIACVASAEPGAAEGENAVQALSGEEIQH